MRTKLKDVVARAGVSASLISNYLNGRSCARMSEATRLRIEEALSALDYRGSGIARMLRTGRSGIVGLISCGLNNEVSQAEMLALISESEQNKLQLFTAYSEGQIERILECVKKLSARGCDGIMISGRFSLDDCKRMNEVSIPLVILNTAELPELPPRMIHYNYRRGVNEAMAALQAAGHREICYFGSPMDKEDPRLRTFLDSQDKDLVLDFQAALSQEQIKDFLNLHPNCRGALCINDLVALQLIGTLNALGISVPDDFSVVGFDNIKAASYTLPPLCSISRPLSDAVHAALSMLCKQIEDSNLLPINYPAVQVQCRYVARGSISFKTKTIKRKKS